MPLTREISGAVPSSHGEQPMARMATLASITNGISLIIIPLPICMGRARATAPIMSRVLKILLPTTLPMAMPVLPSTADMTLMVSSGADVPKATMVRPTIRSDRPNLRAIAAAPSVR